MRAPKHNPFPGRVKRHAPPERSRQAGRQHATNSAAWRAIREQVLLRDLYTCQSCGKLVGGKGEAHVDHVDGNAMRNPNDLTNVQTLCVRCHSTKTAEQDGGFGNWTNRKAGGGSKV